jgi:hypothetical protein
VAEVFKLLITLYHGIEPKDLINDLVPELFLGLDAANDLVNSGRINLCWLIAKKVDRFFVSS